MPATYRRTSLSRVVDLVAFDLIVGLLLTWVIYDNPRRWPVLLVLIPVILLINFMLGRRAFGGRKTTSYALPAIYSCGLIYGVWMAVEEFMWWKLALVVVPLTLLILSIRRSRVAESTAKRTEN